MLVAAAAGAGGAGLSPTFGDAHANGAHGATDGREYGGLGVSREACGDDGGCVGSCKCCSCWSVAMVGAIGNGLPAMLKPRQTRPSPARLSTQPTTGLAPSSLAMFILARGMEVVAYPRSRLLRSVRLLFLAGMRTLWSGAWAAPIMEVVKRALFPWAGDRGAPPHLAGACLFRRGAASRQRSPSAQTQRKRPNLKQDRTRVKPFVRQSGLAAGTGNARHRQLMVVAVDGQRRPVSVCALRAGGGFSFAFWKAEMRSS